MPSVSISTTSPAERRSPPAGRHPRAPHQVAGAGVGAVGAAPAGGGGEHPSPSALDRGRLAGAGRGRHRRGLGGGRARAGGGDLPLARGDAVLDQLPPRRPGDPERVRHVRDGGKLLDRRRGGGGVGRRGGRRAERRCPQPSTTSCFPSRGSRVRIPSPAPTSPPRGEEAPSHRAEIADLVALWGGRRPERSSALDLKPTPRWPGRWSPGTCESLPIAACFSPCDRWAPARYRP